MEQITPLTHLMASERESNVVVAITEDICISWQEFTQEVAFWFSLFSHSTAQSWVLYTRDSYQFAAILVALWHAKKKVVLPGNNLMESLQYLVGVADAFVGDFSQEILDRLGFKGEFLQESPTLRKTISVGEGFSTSEILNAEHVAVTVFTSGSTGEPKPIEIKFSQLNQELRCHESLWGTELGVTPILATVSHQHLYGLIFKVLWPLSAARPFYNPMIDVVEELVRQAQKYKEQFNKVVVVTTPSHLSRLPETILWQKLTGCWAKIFSSAAPLSFNDSENAKEKFATDITEIYGSSETGGIAWRQQTSASGDIWQCFPGVKIAQEMNTRTLKLKSLFLPSTQWFDTADKVELVSSDSFRLCGRIDRIAKVEGKRVSLTALENVLVLNEDVAEARVLLKQDRRMQTYAVIKLSAYGAALLAQSGRKAVSDKLRKYMLQQFEAVVVPRKWRYVNDFPCDEQGKVSQQKLLQLFDAEI